MNEKHSDSLSIETLLLELLISTFIQTNGPVQGIDMALERLNTFPLQQLKFKTLIRSGHR